MRVNCPTPTSTSVNAPKTGDDLNVKALGIAVGAIAVLAVGGIALAKKGKKKEDEEDGKDEE